MSASVLQTSRLFCAQVLQELRKVVWPTRRDVILTSVIVFILAALFACFLVIVDRVLILMLTALLDLAHG
jgi:preprotein translocase subunit SecE